MINQVIMWIMACGAILGGIDYLLHNRFGIGNKFEDGFKLMGPTAFSMVGILCLAPFIANLMEKSVAPFFSGIGIDPGMLGSVLAIDMGGYPLSVQLAKEEIVGLFAGILVAATFGCTVSFTIPVGMGMLTNEEGHGFAKGILVGMITLPIVLVVGGLGFGLSIRQVLWFCFPLLILCVLLGIGIICFTEQMVKGFKVFAEFIRIIAVVGLILGAVIYMTGMKTGLPIAPIEDGMKVAAAIGVVMLGSLPVAEILTRILKKPFSILEKKTGLSSGCYAALLMATVSAVPAMIMSKELTEKERMTVAAYMVSATATLAAHLGYTYQVAPDYIALVVGVKLLGGLAAVLVCMGFSKRNSSL